MPGDFLEITAERFPNLTPQQVLQLQAIGPIPNYVYRANPDITVRNAHGQAAFPIITRPSTWSGFLDRSMDAAVLPPPDASGSRQLLYVGGPDTAGSYAHIHMHSYWEGEGVNERLLPADALSIDEHYRRSRSSKPLLDFAADRDSARLYRMETADIISRMGPDAVMVRDTGQNASSWAVVGQMREPVPATHIQRVNTGSVVRTYRDPSTGHEVSTTDYSGIAALEPPVQVRTPHAPSAASHVENATRLKQAGKGSIQSIGTNAFIAGVMTTGIVMTKNKDVAAALQAGAGAAAETVVGLPMAVIDGVRNTDGTIAAMISGAAKGAIEYAAPEVAEGNSTCVKFGGVVKVVAGGLLGAFGVGFGGALGNVPGAIAGAVGGGWLGGKLGDGVEALCKMATADITPENLAMTAHKPSITATPAAHKTPDTTKVAQGPNHTTAAGRG